MELFYVVTSFVTLHPVFSFAFFVAAILIHLMVSFSLNKTLKKKYQTWVLIYDSFKRHYREPNLKEDYLYYVVRVFDFVSFAFRLKKNALFKLEQTQEDMESLTTWANLTFDQRVAEGEYTILELISFVEDIMKRKEKLKSLEEVYKKIV